MSWIKMRTSLLTSPKVIAIASSLASDEFAVAGRLLAVWSWLDLHSEDGKAVPITSAYIDSRLAFCPGFASAMRSVGWISGEEGSLTFPEYSEHNGETAKARAVTQKRVASFRKPKPKPDDCNGATVTPPLQKALPEERREEENREEENRPPPTTTPTVPMASPSGGVAEGKGSKRLPTTEQSRRIATLFRRKHTTAWSEKEVAAYKLLGTIPNEDLDSIERYYAAERAKGEAGRHRRDLGTFLNNFAGELDRARSGRPAQVNSSARSELAKEPARWRKWCSDVSGIQLAWSAAPDAIRKEFKEWDQQQG